MQTSRGYKIVEILQTSYMNGPRGGGFILREGGSLHIAAHGLSRSVGSGRRERSDVAAESTLVFVRGNQTLSTRLDEGRWVLCGIPLMSAINAPLIYVYSRALAKRAMHSNAIYIVIFIFSRHALACCSKNKEIWKLARSWFRNLCQFEVQETYLPPLSSVPQSPPPTP